VDRQRQVVDAGAYLAVLEKKIWVIRLRHMSPVSIDNGLLSSLPRSCTNTDEYVCTTTTLAYCRNQDKLHVVYLEFFKYPELVEKKGKAF